jgi:hypothetical protein
MDKNKYIKGKGDIAYDFRLSTGVRFDFDEYYISTSEETRRW